VSELAKIFKAYDIRGIVPDELDEKVAESVGAAFVRLTDAATIVTVHDMRTSSALLAEAFCRGAATRGAATRFSGSSGRKRRGNLDEPPAAIKQERA
jgi:phosphomannomutase